MSLVGVPGASAGKGSPHDSAWIMPLRTWSPLNLSKASQFGSTLTSRRPPCRFFPIWGRRFVPIHSLGWWVPLGVCMSEILCVSRFAARRGSDVPFWVFRRHVVVFSARMRKIFPFGVPRGALTVHGAPSKVLLTCKSPGRALRVSGERGSAPFQPAPNRNILRIRARFPTRWPLPALLLFRTAC